MRLFSLCAVSTLLLASFGCPAQTDPVRRISEEKVTSAVSALLPEGVDLEEIKVESMQVSVSGIAVDTVQLSLFMRRLSESNDFDTPQLESVSNLNSSSAFTLSTTIQCPVAGSGQSSVLCGEAPPKTTPVHKCMVNGTLTFQGTPCPQGKDG